MKNVTYRVTVDIGLARSSRSETFTIPRDEWEEMDGDARAAWQAECEESAQNQFVTVYGSLEE